MTKRKRKAKPEDDALTPAEREVWDRIQTGAWSQLKHLFPRLEPYESLEDFNRKVNSKHRRYSPK